MPRLFAVFYPQSLEAVYGKTFQEPIEANNVQAE